MDFRERSMDSGRRPSVGVLCFRAWREASSESPWVFEDASRLHDLKRPSLFRRDEVPARNTHRPSGFAFTPLKKFLRVPRGVFSKTHPWQGVGQRPTKRGRASQRGTPFQAGQSPFTKHRQTVRLRLYALKKVFEGSKGRFFKNAPWQGVGQRPTKGECEPVCGARLFRRDKVSVRNAHRQSGLAFTLPKKFLRVPRGVFSKTRPWQSVGQRPTKRGKASPSGCAFSGGTKSLHETPTDRPALPSRT